MSGLEGQESSVAGKIKGQKIRPKQNRGLLNVVQGQNRAPQYEERLQRDSEASTRVLKGSRCPKHSSGAQRRLIEYSRVH